jgi:hypothetical protein
MQAWFAQVARLEQAALAPEAWARQEAVPRLDLAPVRRGVAMHESEPDLAKLPLLIRKAQTRLKQQPCIHSSDKDNE